MPKETGALAPFEVEMESIHFGFFESSSLIVPDWLVPISDEAGKSKFLPSKWMRVFAVSASASLTPLRSPETNAHEPWKWFKS
jgi:hypothetical protein